MTTAVTLVVLLAILLLGGYYGSKALFAPLPGNQASTPATSSCKNINVKKGQKIRARQVQVSIYNSGTRAGLAGETLAKLRKRGFRPGDVGNAPSDVSVKRAQVWTTSRHDAAARLVARQLGAGAPVKYVDRNLGPGVDVVLGNYFHKLAPVKNFLVTKRSGSACLPRSSGG